MVGSECLGERPSRTPLGTWCRRRSGLAMVMGWDTWQRSQLGRKVSSVWDKSA